MNKLGFFEMVYEVAKLIPSGRVTSYGAIANYVRVSAKYDPLRVNEIITVSISGINVEGYAEVEELLEYIHA